ncbi:hypothetical protein SPB21_34675 [Leptothoe sp. ISB3NOV94-8A]
MSAYTPLSHNRLLALEHHIRGHQPRVRSVRQQPLQQPVRRRRRAKETQQASMKKQEAPPSMDYKALMQRLGEPPTPRLKQPQHAPASVAPNPALQNPQPQPTQQSAGAYRQLAAQLGQRYHSFPKTRTPNVDLPTVPTPINPNIVETFSVTPTPDTIAKKQRRQTLNSLLESSSAPPWAKHPSKPTPSAPPASRSTQTSNPQPTAPLTSYKSLATTIRQARLGLSSDLPEPATVATTFYPPATNGAVDEVCTTDADASSVESTGVIQQDVTEVEIAQPPIAREQIRLTDNLQIADGDLQLENYPKVNPNYEREAQSNVPSLESQVVKVFSGSQMQSSEKAIFSKETPTKDIPASAATIDVVPIVDTDDTSVDSTLPSTFDIEGLRNNVLLLTYQLACPPQLVNHMAQLQRKRHRRKQSNKQSTPSAQNTTQSSPKAS